MMVAMIVYNSDIIVVAWHSGATKVSLCCLSGERLVSKAKNCEWFIQKEKLRTRRVQVWYVCDRCFVPGPRKKQSVLVGSIVSINREQINVKLLGHPD